MVVRRSCRGAVAVLLGIFLGIVMSGCQEEAGLTLRTDPEPLSRRLNLPRHIGSVRWVAVSPVRDTGWIPPKVEFYDVYGYIELDKEGWKELEKTAAQSGRRGTITIPA